MATYAELYNLHNNSALRNRVIIAVVVAAETVMNEDPGTANHANRLLWASDVFANPTAEANRMFMAVLAANKDQTIAQIEAATDVAIQNNVGAHIDLFATGEPVA